MAQEFIQIESHLVFEHEIGCSAELVGQDRERFSLFVLLGKSIEVFLRGLVALDEEHRGFAERPLEVSIADLLAAGPVVFPVGFFSTLDQASIGAKVLDGFESLDILDFVEHHQGKDSAYAWNGLEQVVGEGIVSICSPYDLALQRDEDPVIGIDHLQVDFHVLLNAGVVESIHDPLPVFGLGNAPERVREIVLASGVLDMAEELCPLSHQMISSSQKISCGPHLGGIDVCLSEHAASQECGDLVGIDLVVLALSPMDCFHVQGVAQHEGDVLSGTKIGHPIPGEHAFCSHDDVFPVGLNEFQERLGIRTEVSVCHSLSGAVEDADVHFLCVQINSAVILVLFGVKSHRASSFVGV